MNFAQATRLITKKIQNELSSYDGEGQYKMVLMLRTGVEVTTKSGRRITTYPIGANLDWLIAHLHGEESPFISLRFTGKHVSDLIALAEYDNVAKEVARELINKILEQKDSLPEELRLFLKSSNEKKQTPKKRGPHEAHNLYRNQCIAECINLLKTCKYKPLTKNSSFSTEKNSACHIVSEALKNIGIHISYEAIKFIWGSYKDFYNPVDEILKVSFTDCESN